MADALTTITKIINSPPGQLAAGGVLAGIVWKFFERVEGVLTDQTKLEIAVWLLGVRVSQKVESWPGTFSKIFDRVFGKKHLSWKCFWRSGMASASLFVIALSFTAQLQREQWLSLLVLNVSTQFLLMLVAYYISINWLTDYLALLITRGSLWAMKQTNSVSLRLLLLLADVLLAAYLGYLLLLLPTLRHRQWSVVEFLWSAFANMIVVNWRDRSFVLVFPTFFTSIWLWLYAGSGFIIKAARRFDIGFEWFNRKFDIEKKPLQSIGLVAGALVAIVYWAAVIVGRVVG
jgi:hypothetical protein